MDCAKNVFVTPIIGKIHKLVFNVYISKNLSIKREIDAKERTQTSKVSSCKNCHMVKTRV